MNPIEWIKAAGSLYRWLVKGHLQNRSEHASRNVRTAAVVRSASVMLRWYEWPAARELQREDHGTIEDSCYRAWVNVTPPGILTAIALTGRIGRQAA